MVLATAIAVAVAAVGLAAAGSSAARPREDPAIGLRLIGNFAMPQYVARAPGQANAGLVFVVEDAGTIRTVRGGDVVGDPFLDITRLVDDGGERGLLSVAFPPDYGTSGRFYVYFTNLKGNNEVDEFTVSAGDATDVVDSSRRCVVVFPHPLYDNHNGGQLQFDRDGLLWISTGDGGGGGDPEENAQDLDSPLGKLLRIDPRQNGSAPYSVPPDNPFVGLPGRDAIYAYGLRNPWRFSIDGNHIAIGDVGQEQWEEIDYETLPGARGANFGWDNYEGTHLYEGPPLTRQQPPIFEYSSGDETSNCAVTGGFVVHDPDLPQLAGRYVYADFCAGELRSLVPAVAGATDDAPLGITVDEPTSFGLGPGQGLYVASLAGPVYRLVAR